MKTDLCIIQWPELKHVNMRPLVCLSLQSDVPLFRLQTGGLLFPLRTRSCSSFHSSFQFPWRFWEMSLQVGNVTSPFMMIKVPMEPWFHCGLGNLPYSLSSFNSEILLTLEGFGFCLFWWPGELAGECRLEWQGSANSNARMQPAVNSQIRIECSQTSLNAMGGGAGGRWKSWAEELPAAGARGFSLRRRKPGYSSAWIDYSINKRRVALSCRAHQSPIFATWVSKASLDSGMISIQLAFYEIVKIHGQGISRTWHHAPE